MNRFAPKSFPTAMGRASLAGRRAPRRGQTLVEYALIVAYISLIAVQSLSYLGFITTKQLIYSTASLQLAQYATSSVAVQESMVDNYVSNPAIWGNSNPDLVPQGIIDVENRLHYIIEHPGSY